ncbi:MAG: TldD/PmbA family protein [Deltaproteobacteria bacterium]|nr:TldD/PmbA family protein [Deltaproteobacteria bacterium]
MEQAEKIVSKARSAGADVAEAIVREGADLSARVRVGQVEVLEEASHHSAGLRVIRDHRVALTSTSDLSPEGIDRFVRDGIELAELSQTDPFAGPADPALIAKGPFASLDLFDPSVDEVGAQEAIDAALAGERGAREFDPRITNMQSSTFSRGTGATAVVLSAGFSSTWQSSMVSLSVVPVADDTDGKKRRSGWYEARRHRADLPEAAAIGREAARRTVGMLGARKVPTTEAAVVFPQESAASLIGLLASCIVGSSVWRRSSYLAARENTRIASDLVTIVDDPLIPRGFGSRAHDGEGLLSRRNIVVERGILRTFLCDSYAGRKLERSSTASGSRGSNAAVGPGTTNFILQPVAGSTEQDIIRSTPRGLYVTEMMGFGFNATTGDFSRGASGYWIEDGELTHPVSEVTISLNLDRLLQSIDAIADRFELRSSILTPALRVASMTIGGS